MYNPEFDKAKTKKIIFLFQKKIHAQFDKAKTKLHQMEKKGTRGREVYWYSNKPQFFGSFDFLSRIFFQIIKIHKNPFQQTKHPTEIILSSTFGGVKKWFFHAR